MSVVLSSKVGNMKENRVLHLDLHQKKLRRWESWWDEVTFIHMLSGAISSHLAWSLPFYTPFSRLGLGFCKRSSIASWLPVRLCHSGMLMENGRLAPSYFLWAFCLLPVPGTIIQPCIFTKPDSWFQEQLLNPVSHVSNIDRTCLLYSHLLQHQLQTRRTPSSEIWVSNLTVPPLMQNQPQQPVPLLTGLRFSAQCSPSF